MTELGGTLSVQTQTTAATAPPAPVDLLCVRCRYALKGTPARDPCPECGLPVSESLARPGLINANVAVLARLRRWSLVLALSAGCLFLLTVALSYAVIASISFFLSTPSPLASTLMDVLPPAMLVSVIVTGMALVRATASIHDAESCSSRARKMVTVGSVLLAGGWGLMLVEQFVRTGIFNGWLITAALWIGGSVVAVCWSQVLRMAARSLGSGPQRVFAMLQLATACVFSLAGGVLVLGVFLGLPYLPGGYAIYSICQNALPYVIFAVLLLTAINAFVLSMSTSRLLTVRRAASAM